MIHVILIEPENEGNIGAIARVMKNFGFEKLVLINPKVKISDVVRARAKHAQDVLDNALIADVDYLSKMDLLVGTTAKVGTDYNVNRTAIVPQELATQVGDRDFGLLIGREGIGLTNEELKKCDIVVTIPANSDYPTLNISHALAILLYELSKHSGDKSNKDIEPATRKDIGVLQEYVDNAIDEMDFSLEKKEIQKTVWKRFIGKSMLSKREAFAMMGFFRKANLGRKP